MRGLLVHRCGQVRWCWPQPRWGWKRHGDLTQGSRVRQPWAGVLQPLAGL